MEEFNKAELVRRLKKVRDGRQLSTLTPEEREVFLARERELSVQQTNARELPAAEVARRFGLRDEYITVFRMSSPFVHPTTRALEEAAQRQGGRLIGLQFGPSSRYTEIHVFTLAEYLLRGAGELGNLLELTQHLRRWNRIYAGLRALQPRWPKDNAEQLI